MLKIGLTGGIASGKSAVADLLGEFGATIIDTDVIARDVVAPGEAGLAAVADAFGAGILGADGTLDRARLRKLVFADPAKRRQLEAILHPLIRARALAAAAAATGPYAVFVVPLLVETDFRALVDRVLVVDCDPQTQIDRLTARDGIPVAEAQRMLAAQAGRDERLAAADDLIDNNGNRDAMRATVAALHAHYLELAAANPAASP